VNVVHEIGARHQWDGFPPVWVVRLGCSVILIFPLDFDRAWMGFLGLWGFCLAVLA
jgi:hypothetical protein